MCYLRDINIKNHGRYYPDVTMNFKDFDLDNI